VDPKTVLNAKTGLSLLFDLSFSEFLTTRIIRVLFLIGIGLAGVGVVAMIAMGFTAGVGWGLLSLFLSPVVFLLYVIFARIGCELLIVVFRVAENTGRLVDQGRK